MTEEQLYNLIVMELGHFKFNRNSMAYEYLIDAITLVTEHKVYIRSFKAHIYSQIAKKYETKPDNVMWSIAKLVNLMCLNTEEKTLMDYFNMAYYERPSAKAFIIEVSRKVSNQIGGNKRLENLI